ncbi:MAG: hypothetical protein K1X54_03045 [Flavobacteriales bacterium]|nr:hypothetical protein [Flavobacteriales bacterium]
MKPLMTTSALTRVLLLLATVIGVSVFVSCKKDEEPVEEKDPPIVEYTGVNVVASEFPFEKLSDYRFYTGEMKQLIPNERVLPYQPVTPLFSDYAHKSRFVWMPEGVSASYQSDHTVFDFPDGTVLIKNFFYDHVQPDDVRRILETRIIYKKNGEWLFADYLWNPEQTEAYYSLNGAYVPITWIDDNGNTRDVNFRIPAEAECHTCHKANQVNSPTGVKPQNLNFDYPFSDGSMNQLQKWIEVGYLENSLPESIVSVADWTDESLSVDLRLRSYLDANCSHCHSDDGHCYYRPLRLGFSQTADESNLGVCIAPQEYINETLTHVISRGNKDRSVMYYRLNTTDQQYRMPLFGRSLIHDEGVQLLEEYINSLSPGCPN